MAEKRDKKGRGLGRGLSALMADVPGPESMADRPAPKAEATIAVDRISPNPDQPRRRFAPEALDELAASIEEKGIIQPLILRADPASPGQYQIVAGERRWRAAQKARLHEVPAIVRDFDDTEVLEIAIIENIQRADLDAIEEAAGYRQLMDRFGHTQDQLAQALGKSRSHVANTLRLLGLPEEIQTMVAQGQLSAGHARALLTAEDPVGLAREAVRKGMSVREVERRAKSSSTPKRAPAQASRKDADTRALEDDLMAALRIRVSIDHRPGAEDGALTIKYRSLDQLDDLCRRLSAVSEMSMN